ncbi:LexA family protein [Enterobacter asburiae]|uniref:LexA family protein n=1 Tax=Enterobacter asburiae TaxID=61645 RepID=UPI00192A7310|nr:SOS-response repressor and protease LexA [Enterobacter asburiae]MBL5837222.1 SOS-response repressor and protease LexA [Enterobacter asburiae]MBL5960043.1 SOS-response repressor and protease LexA [Enterobacter asburiae]
MIELTSRQSEAYEAIKVHIEKVGFPPTLIELAGLIGCSSQNAAAEHVKALKKKGYLTTASGAARGISLIEQKPKRLHLGLNDQVKIKLFEPGIEHLKCHYQELNIPYEDPKLDADGYATMTLWYVMSTFGDILYNGAPHAFELAIDLEAK